MEQHISQETNNVILGDFNLHINDKEDPDATHFMDTMSALGYDQHIHFFTQKDGNTLDHLYNEHISKMSILNICQGPFLSDHSFISFMVDYKPPIHRANLHKYRKIQDIDHDEMEKHLELLLTALDPLTEMDKHRLANNIECIFSTLLDIHAPEFIKKRT